MRDGVGEKVISFFHYFVTGIDLEGERLSFQIRLVCSGAGCSVGAVGLGRQKPQLLRGSAVLDVLEEDDHEM